MASAPFRVTITSISDGRRLLVGNPWNSANVGLFPRRRCAAVSFSSRRSRSATSKKMDKKLIQENGEEDEDLDEDAFEALFQQLEDDLKNDELNGGEDADDDMDDDDLANLEKELASALEDDDLLGALDYPSDGEINETEDKVEEDEEVDMPVKLKNWQIRRLAYALKNGRRKTAIKSLATELCLDRVIVLKLLRDPPPNLIMMAATLPDRPISVVADTAENPIEITPSSLPEPPVKQKDLPVHLMQRDWIARKRLKKIHIQTLERVYRRTKRPTNAMISSIVHVTNLPRRKVLKWFEDKRAEEGVPERRIPYTRSTSRSVFSLSDDGGNVDEFIR